MRKQSNPKTAWAWAFGLVFVMLASMHISAKPRIQAQVKSTTSQQTPATKTKKSYACPMHPEVKSTKPGKCPKCKMDLKPVSEVISSVDNESHAPHSAVGENVTAAVTSSATTTNGLGNVPRSSKELVIPDVEVLDQEGNALHFYSDLIMGKTVAINFIFTNCTTICPPLAATFARVQREMGDKVGKDVHFISISVDPLTDTPERLKAWGAKFKAGVGWTFVTGNKQEMDKLLNALGASVSRREDHTPAVIIGNDAKGVWTRTYGLAKPSQIVELIEDVREGRIGEQRTKEPTKP